MTTTFEIPASLDGERIDRCLALFTGRTRSEIATLIASGGVQIDGTVVTVRHRRVVLGEHIGAELDTIVDEVEAPLPNASVPFRVVYEDAELLVIDKPAGVVVHPGAGHQDDTLVSGLLAAYPDLAGADTADPVRPGIVHRLDKETSGLLVVARSEAVRANLQVQLAERTMKRTYLVVARGAFDNEDGVIEAPIGRSVRNPTRMAVREGGRAARTHYHVISHFTSPEDLTYLEVRLDTGRTHQIRVHFQAISHPVAGDRQYGGAISSFRLARPFLHAWRLEFTHPTSGEPLDFVAPLPADLAGALALLA